MADRHAFQVGQLVRTGDGTFALGADHSGQLAEVREVLQGALWVRFVDQVYGWATTSTCRPATVEEEETWVIQTLSR